MYRVPDRESILRGNAPRKSTAFRTWTRLDTDLAAPLELTHTQNRMSTLPRWTLQDLFSSPSDPRIETTLKDATEQAHAFAANKGRLASATPTELLNLIQTYEGILQALTKPVTYASLYHAQNTMEPEREGFLRVMREKCVKIEHEMLWFELELAKLPEEQLQAFTSAPELSVYTHYIQRILRIKPHQLSEREERLVSQLQQTGAEAFMTLFEQEVAGKRFTFGEQQESLTKLLELLHTPDRSLREQAASAISNGLEEEEVRRSFIYTTLIKNKEAVDQIRSFATPQASRHLANETSEEAVRTMIEIVERRANIMQKYYLWKAKRLGIEQLTDYDRYAPLQSVEKKYTFDEARDLVLSAFRAFSPDFAEHAKTFFDNGWIDAEPSPGKRTGAFCSYVSPDHHPYVFVNYQGRIGDVLTLAHELGHAIHATLSKPVGYLGFDIPLTLAETASVFAEMLTFDLLRKQLENQPDDLTALCANKIESIFATVYRQASMHRFEELAHAHVRANGYATPATFHSLWLQSQQTLFGDSVKLQPEYRVWWSYIGHFIEYPFYVYAYTFGELLTCCLYEQATHDTSGTFAEKYMAMLAKGGSKTPEEILAPMGISPTSAATWEQGLDWIERLVDETIANDKKTA